jgi:hypothetical protein
MKCAVLRGTGRAACVDDAAGGQGVIAVRDGHGGGVAAPAAVTSSIKERNAKKWLCFMWVSL